MISQKISGGVPEPPTRAGQRRHHGADRHVHDVSDLFVRKAFQFAQDQNLSEANRKVAQRLLDNTSVGVLEQQLFRTRRLHAAGMNLLIEQDSGLAGTPLPKPPVRRIAHNREQPRSRVAAAESARVLKRSKVGFLHHVLRIFATAHEPARQVVRGIEMREKEFGKPANLSLDGRSVAHRYVLLTLLAHIRDGSLPVECALGEGRSQWKRHPKSLGCESSHKSLETKDLRELLLWSFGTRGRWRRLDGRSTTPCLSPALPFASASAYSRSTFEPASSGSTA